MYDAYIFRLPGCMHDVNMYDEHFHDPDTCMYAYIHDAEEIVMNGRTNKGILGAERRNMHKSKVPLGGPIICSCELSTN